MSQTNLPLSFWSYALESATFILNRVPPKAVEKTPYELWTGKMPNLSFLKIWGCEAYVKRPISDKLAPKSIKCNFVGYPKETKGYYFYIPSENKVFVARNGTFLEKEFISQRFSGSTVRPEETQAPQKSIEPPIEPLSEPQTVVETERVTQVPCRSDRTRHQPERYGFLMTDSRELLLEDVYMTQPKGFVIPENSRKICKLQRSIYGLKQASRS